MLTRRNTARSSARQVLASGDPSFTFTLLLRPKKRLSKNEILCSLFLRNVINELKWETFETILVESVAHPFPARHFIGPLEKMLPDEATEKIFARPTGLEFAGRPLTSIREVKLSVPQVDNVPIPVV